MTRNTLLLLLVLVPFAALTVVALKDHGYMGVIQLHLETTAGLQVITDLVILAVLGMLWIVQDSRARGINPWPFVAITLVLASFGPLTYLLWRELRAQRPVLA